MDILLQQSLNDGDIEVINGDVTIDESIQTYIYLSLFGGFDWWGNQSETGDSVFTSSTLKVINGSPIDTNIISKLTKAIDDDLQFLEHDYTINIVLPAVNTVSIELNVVINNMIEKFNIKIDKNLEKLSYSITTGNTWNTVISTGSNLNLWSIGRNPATGVLVTVGLEGTILRSADDGETWSDLSIATSLTLTTVIYNPNISTWVAVGLGSASNQGLLYKSEDDGLTWNEIVISPAPSTNFGYWGLSYNDSIMVFSCENISGQGVLVTSTDLVTFNITIKADTAYLHRSAFDSNTNTWFICGGDILSNEYLASSTDLVTFNKIDTPCIYNIWDVAIFKGTYIIGDGNGGLFKSDNLINWKSISNPGGDYPVWKIITDNNIVMIVGGTYFTNDGYILTSSDNEKYNLASFNVPGITPYRFSEAVYNGNYWIACGHNGRIFKSTI